MLQVKTSVRRKHEVQAQVQIGSILDRDDLTHRQIATRQQKTEVRSDDVSTAQVHHYDPELRARVLMSDVIDFCDPE